MTSLATAALSAACIYSGALIGIALQRVLPQHHLAKDSQEVVKLGAGMIATLTALVLGLLVSSAKSSFDSANGAVVQSAAKYVMLDRALAHAGPAAAPVRVELREGLQQGLERMWPKTGASASAVQTLEQGTSIEEVQEQVRGIATSTDAERQWLAQAQQLSNDLAQQRWLVIEQSQAPLPHLFLMILVAWLSLLFVTFGLYSPKNGTVFAALGIGAISISAAIFLVLELNHPLSGSIRVSDGPMRNALEHMGK